MAMNQLISDVQAGLPFTPKFNDMFKSLDLCSLDGVRVVFVNTLPYANAGVADGLAFSVPKDLPATQMPASADLFQDALEKTRTPEQDEFSYELDYLVKQGVLLLNMSITCPIGKPENHLPMWKPLFEKLIHDIAYRTLGTIFVFIGPETEYLHQYVRKGQYKFFLPDTGKDWDYMDVFNKINEILKKNDKHPINW